MHTKIRLTEEKTEKEIVQIKKDAQTQKIEIERSVDKKLFDTKDSIKKECNSYSDKKIKELRRKIARDVRMDLNDLYLQLQILSNALTIKDKELESLYKSFKERIYRDLNSSISTLNSDINITRLEVGKTIESLRGLAKDIDTRAKESIGDLKTRLEESKSELDKKIADSSDTLNTKIDEGLILLDGKVSANIKALDEKTENNLKNIDEKISMLDEKTKTSLELIESRTNVSLTEIERSTNEKIRDIETELNNYVTIEDFSIGIDTINNRITNEINEANEKIYDLKDDIKRVGEVFIWLRRECPASSRPLRGGQIDTPELSAILGLDFLPDFRSQFLRVAGDSRDLLSVEQDATAINGLRLQVKPDSFGFSNGTGYDRSTTTNYFVEIGDRYPDFGYLRYTEIPPIDLISGDSETRPKNIAIQLCIRTK